MINKITKNDLLEKISNKKFEELDSSIENLIPKLNGVFPVSEKDLFNIVREELPLKYLDVTEVRVIDGLFKNKTITDDLSLWDTSNFISLKETFYRAVIKSDISMWVVTNVRDLSEAFCYAKVDCDLSKWDTQNVETLYMTFEGAEKDFGFSKWNTQNVTNLAYALYGASIEDLDLSAWVTSKVKLIYNFLSYYGYKKIIIENDKMDSEEYDYYFEKIKDKEFNVNISNWDTKNISDSSYMLYFSEAKVDISKWNISNLRNADYMFAHYKFINFELKNFDLKNLYVASSMFFNSNIKEDLSEWQLVSIENISWMFGRTEYAFDIEHMLKNSKSKRGIETIGVVFQNKNYKHLTSKRDKFYIGNNNFTEEELIDKTYEERIKFGLPLKIKKDDLGEILNFKEDKKIVFSKLKFKDEVKKAISEKGLEALYDFKHYYEESHIKHIEGIKEDSEFYFLSGRCEKYNQTQYESYYDFDRVCILYVLKDGRLESVFARNNRVKESMSNIENYRKMDSENIGYPFIKSLYKEDDWMLVDDLNLLEIEEERSVEEAQSNIKKTLLQKTIIFLNKLLVNS